ncbi:pseudouridine synthase [Lewinellaceae bacterium SD302]|nr:pseudouridine synthase [Lewinellaceae bacterium SD302]
MKSPRRFQRSQARNSAKPPGMTRKPAEIIGMRLNKYLAHSGVASRRNAAEFVKNGQVTVNDVQERNPAYQIQEGDVVAYKGQVVSPSETLVYVLLNKPRNVITTTSDEKDRTTVMDLITDPSLEGLRLFPVGRLDRDTTGLLLITNDGDTAKKLTHPSHEVAKVYQATLDRPFEAEDLEKLRAGLELEDGPAKVDWANVTEGSEGKTIGLRIHIGRNRIVRRMFAHLGYKVERLDRTFFAGLTKKDLPRKFYRFLTEEEVRMIRHFS